MISNKDKLVKIIDFWHSSLKKSDLFSREAIEKIDYKSKEIIDITGPRRSGKSSLFKLIISRLGLKDNFLYINFEDPFFIENNTAEVIEEIVDVYKEYYNTQLEYLFFDEIQEIQSWERVVRKFRDGEQYKMFITGSSSTLLSREMASAITGRHKTIDMFPLSYSEFLFFNKIDINTKRDIILKESLLRKAFDEYMEIGGFPEVCLTRNKELLKNYFYDFLQKDIVVRHDIRDKSALEKMAVFLMSNSGKIISIASMEKAFYLSYEAANNYLEYLKEAFLVFELPQFSFSLKKQSKALSKIYSIDTGLAREVGFSFSQDHGRILENVIFLELRRMSESIFYYKTRNNLEVDFLMREGSENKKIMQVCWSLNDNETKKREIKSLLEAMKELRMQEGWIITADEESIEKIDTNVVRIVPAWKWILAQKKDLS